METYRSAEDRERDVPIEEALMDEAVSEYYRLYRVALLRRVKSRMEEMDAEDVVQEVFIQALRDVGRYDPARSAPQTWLDRLAGQILAKYFRGQARRRHAEGNYVEATTTKEAHLTHDERVTIQLLLVQLTPLNHRIVAARFLLGESIEEISERTGLAQEAVKKRILRSLENLRGLAGGQRS